MRLAKIKLAGFKSFVDPTVIQLPSSLIGVVGPNGCGKSNVIDAVRWVMGESSAKHLRGDSMDDVIFNGSSSRKPVGQAAVELVFDNSDGTLGGQYAQYNEISVKRQVSRDGQSNYYLNGSRCRRRDITDIFLGTGLGPRSYAIIEQGMISRLVEAKPEDLRIYLEEAAGISKYKERRKETETRIRHTRENLDILNVSREEVGKQLEHLQRQARAAERYKELKDEERKLKAELLVLRWRQLDQDYQQRQKLLSEKETALQGVIAEQRAIEALIEKDREGLVEVNEAFNTVQGRYYAVGADISRSEQSIQHGKATVEQYRRELSKADEHWREARQHITEDQQKLEQLRAAIASDEPAYQSLLQDQQSSQTGLSQAEIAMQEWQQAWDEFNRRASEPARVSEVQQARIAQFERNHLQSNDRLQRLMTEREQLDGEGLDEEITLAAEAVELASAAEVEQQGLVEDSNQALRELRAELEQARQHLHQTTTELQTTTGRLSAVEALQQAALGKADANLKPWLQQHGLEQQPRLAERVNAESGWETAVETVLGDYLEAVCLPADYSLQALLDSFAAGSVNLVASDAAPAQSVGQSSQSARLLDKVQAPAVVHHLLANIRIAYDLPQALAMRAELAAHESVITPNGEWLAQHWVRVAHRPATETGVLAREQELKRLQSEQAELQAKLAELEAQRAHANEQLQRQEQAREAALQAHNQAHRQRAEANSRLQQFRARKEQISQQLQRLGSEITELQQRMANDQDELQLAQELLQEARMNMDALALEKAELSAQRDELRDGLDRARQKSHADRNAGHEIAMRMQSMRSSLEATEQNLQRMERQVQQLQARREELLQSIQQAEAPQRQLEQTLDQLLQQRLAVEKELAAARQQVETVESGLRAGEEQRQAFEQRVNDLRADLEQQRLAWQEMRVRRATLEEQLAETGFEREPLLQSLATDADVAHWVEGVEAVARKIQRLGPINLAAIDEFKEQSQRKDYLDSQYADITEALATLEAAIEKIDRETRERFKVTFERVSNRLRELFPRLFGGGQAHLEMTGDDLLSTGVAVMARPPGKRVTNIHLLSGGEKALTAVALVFAFFELNPAPFCMLDEVDAPLDEANVGRFCAMVKEMSEQVQFIFITHNKATMELSTHLMGVTMQEPGVSRLVAVDVQEAARLAQA